MKAPADEKQIRRANGRSILLHALLRVAENASPLKDSAPNRSDLNDYAGRRRRLFDGTIESLIECRHFDTSFEAAFMASQLPVDLQQLINSQLATGLYSSSEEVLRDALHLLVEHQETMDDLHASADDIDAGRVCPLDDVLAEIRQRHGWSS